MVTNVTKGPAVKGLTCQTLNAWPHGGHPHDQERGYKGVAPCFWHLVGFLPYYMIFNGF
jgi:hypothetical protein